MKRTIVGVLFAIGLTAGMIGCSEKTEVKKVETTTTPSGTTTETDTKKVETSGENPPPPAKEP
jgi:hypothetical protein